MKTTFKHEVCVMFKCSNKNILVDILGTIANKLSLSCKIIPKFPNEYIITYESDNIMAAIKVEGILVDILTECKLAEYDYMINYEG